MTVRHPLAAMAVALGLAACSSKPLPVPPAQPMALPAANPPAGMTLSAIEAGKMHSRAGLAYEGGALGEARVFGMGGILVEHPNGALLFDSGFGRKVDEHFKTTPALMRWTTKYEREATVADQLKASGRDPQALTAIVLTHAHWDHVSGVEDLPGVPVWVPRAELEFVNSDHRTTALARQIGTKAYRAYDFPGAPYLGFPASRDVFGDGSVVLVPAPGHTPGSIIAFIALPSGLRYALVGDLAWQSEGIDLPAQRPSIARGVDADPAATRAALIHMHQIHRALPAMIIVPAHDRRIWDGLPKLRPAARP